MCASMANRMSAASSNRFFLFVHSSILIIYGCVNRNQKTTFNNRHSNDGQTNISDCLVRDKKTNENTKQKSFQIRNKKTSTDLLAGPCRYLLSGKRPFCSIFFLFSSSSFRLVHYLSYSISLSLFLGWSVFLLSWTVSSRPLLSCSDRCRHVDDLVICRPKSSTFRPPSFFFPRSTSTESSARRSLSSTVAGCPFRFTGHNCLFGCCCTNLVGSCFSLRFTGPQP